MFLRLTGPDDFGRAAAETAAFAAGLAGRGLPGNLSFAPYYEHPGRYGHGEALAAAEQAWAADTAAAIAQLAMAAAGAPGQALAAASMTRIAAAFAPGPAAGYQALVRCLDQGSGPLDRSCRDLACSLADPAGGLAALRALPGGRRSRKRGTGATRRWPDTTSSCPPSGIPAPCCGPCCTSTTCAPSAWTPPSRGRPAGSPAPPPSAAWPWQAGRDRAPITPAQATPSRWPRAPPGPPCCTSSWP